VKRDRVKQSRHGDENVIPECNLSCPGHRPAQQQAIGQRREEPDPIEHHPLPDHTAERRQFRQRSQVVTAIMANRAIERAEQKLMRRYDHDQITAGPEMRRSTHYLSGVIF